MDSSIVKNSIDTLDLNNPPVFFSYKDHFKKLWDFHSIQNIPESTILIEWDDFPDKTQNLLVETDKYITPIDWAVGYSLYINSKCKESRAYSDLRILIVNNGGSQLVSNSDSLEFVQQSPGMDIISMPWIRIFSLKAPVSGRNLDALFRLLKNLDSDDAKSKNSHQDSSFSASMPAAGSQEDKKPTPISPEQGMPFTEPSFFSQNIGTILTNIRRLVNSFRGGVEAVELSPAEDDTVFESSLDNQRTQPHDSEQDTEICDEPMPSMEEAFRQTDRELDIIKRIWAASLTRPSTPGDHHAIANLVGPLLLTEEKCGDLHVNALQALMRSIGLLPDHKEGNTLKENSENAKAQLGVGNSWIDWECPEWKYKLAELLSKPGDKLNLILIDDMFQISWGKILCRAVGVDYNGRFEGDGKDRLVKISNQNVIGKDEKIVVKAASTADWIIDKLESFTNTDNRFECSFDDGAGQEILFLDLRLYSGRKSEEVEFLERLIKIAAKFKNSDKLPWPGFADNEISEVNKWLNNPERKHEEEGHTIALTFLPRILALTDLSLPIILFSSTGRRDITEKLKRYGNIITVFEKPRFTIEIPIDIAYQTKCKFRDAMKKALQILQARQKIQKISTYKIKDQPKFEGSGIHVELFIDETYETSVGLKKLPHSAADLNTNTEKFRGIYHKNSKLVYRKGPMNKDEEKRLLALSDNSEYRKAINYLYKNSQIYVGGLYAIFSGQDNKTAQEKADGFDDELVRKGVRYFYSLGYGDTSEKIKTKKESSKEELNSVMESSLNKPDALGFIRLSNFLRRENGSGFDFFSPQSADNHFRLTLIALIEVFLCETLPAHFEGSALEDISVSVYVATREKPYSIDDIKQMKEHREAKYRLGMDSTPRGSEKMLSSISRNSIYPIVSDIMSSHHLSRNVHRVVGITFVYKTSKSEFAVFFICRECKEIISVDPTLDIDKDANVGFNVAEVLFFRRDKNNKKYAFIKPIGTSAERVIVFNREWEDINSANSNDLVTFDSIESGKIENGKSYPDSAKGVRLLNTEERQRFYNAEKEGRIIEGKIMECSCGKRNEDYYPDYRALHYIADEILGHVNDVKEGRGYGISIKQIPGGFDDMLDYDLKDTIKASRYLDLKETVSAIAEVKVAEDYKSGDYRVKPLLLQRIAFKLDNLTGDEFSILVQKENRPAPLTRKNK